MLAASIRAVAPEGLQNYARGKRGVFIITRGAPEGLQNHARRPPMFFRIARGPPRWSTELRAVTPDGLEDYARWHPSAFGAAGPEGLQNSAR